MKHTIQMLVLCVGWGALTPCFATEPTCHAAPPFTLRMRFAGESPHNVLLSSSASGGLQMRDAATGNELWSAGPGAGSTQQITGMHASLGASLAALDLDADGLQDRIYAGDRSGRLWRFDLHHGANPAQWMQATVLADLGAAGGGRGFLAAPDVARIEPTTALSWLNIAVGTANTGTPRADHRFYVLRDTLGAATSRTPLADADLAALRPPAGVAEGEAAGYFLELGSAQVLTQALTLDGHIYFTAVEGGNSLLADCAPGSLPTAAVPLSLTVLRATDGAIAADDNRGNIGQPNLRRALPRAMPANSAIELAPPSTAETGRLLCQLNSEPLPNCFLDTRPQRTWWRREDAD